MPMDFGMDFGGVTLSNFPALLALGTNITGFSYSQMGDPTNGGDLRFTDDNLVLLDYEIDTWDDVAETATVWVRVQQLDSGSNTDFIHMYYNNAGAGDAQNAAGVWDANHAGVFIVTAVTDKSLGSKGIRIITDSNFE